MTNWPRMAWLLLAAGCAPEVCRVADLRPRPLPPDDEVLIYSGGNVVRWHALVIRADSLTGIPYAMPAKCDSCRLSLSRAGVDSIQLRYYPTSPEAPALCRPWG
jgi:hypothetical protein